MNSTSIPFWFYSAVKNNTACNFSALFILSIVSDMSYIRVKAGVSQSPWKIKYKEGERLSKYSFECHEQEKHHEAFLALDQALTLWNSAITMKYTAEQNGGKCSNLLKKMMLNAMVLCMEKKAFCTSTEPPVRSLLYICFVLGPVYDTNSMVYFLTVS